MANPYRKPLLNFLPTGTCTLQDAPSFPRRDNDLLHLPGGEIDKSCIKVLIASTYTASKDCQGLPGLRVSNGSLFALHVIIYQSFFAGSEIYLTNTQAFAYCAQLRLFEYDPAQ
ncbi:hypothetical protein [Desulfosarcina ovata]|uniref:hypothetical protein n=1 Tax=Desulfosarcina ovata TaxID=83564 RepID=UPI0012D30926|nr:hypothetical protein [Desulfosarcina ovata]